MLDWLFKFGLERSAEKRGVSSFFFKRPPVPNQLPLIVPATRFEALPLSARVTLLAGSKGMSPTLLPPTSTYARSPLSKPWVSKLSSGLSSTILGITKARGYRSNVIQRNYFESYRPELDEALSERDFPKCVLLFEGARSELRMSGDVTHDARFLVAFIAKGNSAAARRRSAYNFADDLERALHLDSTLGGSAVSAHVSRFFVDSGYSEPESFGVFQLQVAHQQL